jgi:hypothetical protein
MSSKPARLQQLANGLLIRAALNQTFEPENRQPATVSVEQNRCGTLVSQKPPKMSPLSQRRGQ